MPARLKVLTPDQLATAAAAADTKALVKHYLAVLEERAPGRSVEVRVPPFAAVQAIPGVRHTRGTPPAVVETDAETWLAVATGRTTWAEALDSGRVAASGERTDLTPYLPLTGEQA
ncbi:sterol carrier family protein [Nocardioides cavernae]|uniref:sterol carrier family protein n=1 Tax=Nocardioides TaxID=1839 RepID=UPI000AF9B2A0|nr:MULTISPECIES: sterol carrier family protein [Nocardioides]MCK9822096.1 sterol carrier family protein [Nocardioides cavernae]